MSAPPSPLRALFDAALDRVRGDAAVAAWLRAHPEVAYDHLLAFGKAAAAMADGALAARPEPAAGLVITKHGHLEGRCAGRPNLRCLEADHPVPGAASLAAGEALLEFLAAAPAGARFLALISGGASSLVEALVPGLDLAGLGRLTDRLLGAGLPIDRMNAARRSVSRLKGGRLARHLNGRPACALLISDVPGDAPWVIGSGPLSPAPDDGAGSAPPAAAQELLAGAEPVPVPPPEAFANIDTHVIATLEDAKAAAAAAARARGLPTRVHGTFLDGDAQAQGARLARWLRGAEAPAGCHVWGGETTVRLPARPGRGGRNQHLALAAARELDGADGIRLLACGTDGTDGPTADAGGEVDGATLARGRARGLDADAALAAADAGNYLEAAGALVATGPTGTNVMDLVLALKD